jgi:cell division protein DivIC
MIPAWLHRIFLLLVALVALVVVAGLFVVLSGTRAEYASMQAVEGQTRQRLAELELRLAEQEKVLERLRTDPEYVASVIRRRAGYAKPEEFVFRFED